MTCLLVTKQGIRYGNRLRYESIIHTKDVLCVWSYPKVSDIDSIVPYPKLIYFDNLKNSQ